MTVNARLLIAAAAAAVVSLGLSWGSTPGTAPGLVPGLCSVDLATGAVDCAAPTIVPGLVGYTLQGDAARVPLVLGATAIALGLRRRRTAPVRIGLVVAAVGLVPRTEIDPSTGQAGRIVYLAAMMAAVVATGAWSSRRPVTTAAGHGAT